jgi:hypothetical protein
VIFEKKIVKYLTWTSIVHWQGQHWKSQDGLHTQCQGPLICTKDKETLKPIN